MLVASKNSKSAKGSFIKDDMLGDDDSICRQIKVVVSRKTHRVERGASLCGAAAKRFG